MPGTLSVFLRDMQIQKPGIFNKAIALIKGVMITNSLLCRDIQVYKQKLKNTVFYLDTVLALRTLGYEGEEQKQASRDLIELLKLQEADLCIFKHNLDEAKGILQSVEQALVKGEILRRSVFDHFNRIGGKPSDVALARTNLSLDLSGIGINIVERPDHVEEYQIAEEQLEEIIKSMANYKREKAVHRDIESIRSIYTLRNGNQPTLLEDSNAVFVTTNTMLAKAAREYGKRYEQTREVSSTVTDYELTNIVWLKSPQKRANVIEHTVIANSLATLEISEEMWGSIVAETDKLQKHGALSTDVYSYFLCSPRVRQEIADATFGGELEFKHQTLEQILQRVQDEFTRPYKEKLAEENKERITIKANLDTAENINIGVVTRLMGISTFISRVITGLIFLIICIFISYGAVTQIYQSLNPDIQSQLSLVPLAITAVILLTVIGIFSLIFGGNVWSFVKWLDKYLSGYIFHRLADVINIPSDRRAT